MRAKDACLMLASARYGSKVTRWQFWFCALFACGAPVRGDGVPGLPPFPESGTTPTQNVYTFAVHEFFFGDTERDTDTLSGSASKSFGYNLDAKVTLASSADVCTLFPYGAQIDGNNGIDNGFGATLLSNVSPEQGSASSEVTRAIQAGHWTLQIQVAGLSDDPLQTSTGLSVRVFSSRDYNSGNVPAFDESTQWPVLSTSLTDSASITSGAIATFPSAYVVAGTFVSGTTSASLPMSLFHQGVELDLVLHDPIITFVHASHSDVVDGTIAGVLDVQELTATMRAVASHVSPSLCGSAFDGIARQYQAAADILKDGTNRGGVPCDGISVGFGFNAKLIANPTEVTEVAPLVDLCAN